MRNQKKTFIFFATQVILQIIALVLVIACSSEPSPNKIEHFHLWSVVYRRTSKSRGVDIYCISNCGESWITKFNFIFYFIVILNSVYGGAIYYL